MHTSQHEEAALSQKVYRFWRIKRVTDAWHQLPERERNRIFDEMRKNLEDVGGRWILRCTCSWASEGYRGWGINENPDLDADIQDGENLEKMDWARYWEAESMLGLPFEEG